MYDFSPLITALSPPCRQLYTHNTGGGVLTSVDEAVLVGASQVIGVGVDQQAGVSVRPADRCVDVHLDVDGDAAGRLDAVVEAVLDGRRTAVY